MIIGAATEVQRNSGHPQIAPLLPSNGCPGGQWADHRRVVNGIL
jgi:hypothetical protein